MCFEGPGDSSIHRTQLQVTASLTSAGRPVEETVARVLAATREAVKSDPSWNWVEEETAIARMCYDLINKVMRQDGEDLSVCLPETLYDQWQKKLASGERPHVAWNRHGWHVRGYGWQKPDEEGSRENSGADSKEDSSKEEKKQSAPFVLRPFVPFNPATLPPRQFLFGKHYQRRTVGGTVAPGGTGKSTLEMVEGISMATARNLLGEQPGERLRVWYHNGEDNMDELNRRVAAICQYYDIPLDDLAGWFFMTSGNEVPLRVAAGYSNLQINNRLVKCITESIGDNRIDVATFDPLVTLHGVPENDTGKMDTVIRIFANISDAQGCATELSHHTRKQMAGSVADYTVDDARGAGSLKDAMRAVRMLNFMPKTEAEMAGIPDLERTSYFRVDRVKANNSPPAKAATWRKFVNVDLPNGDEVGVAPRHRSGPRPSARPRPCSWYCSPGSHSRDASSTTARGQPMPQACLPRSRKRNGPGSARRHWAMPCAACSRPGKSELRHGVGPTGPPSKSWQCDGEYYGEYMVGEYPL